MSFTAAGALALLLVSSGACQNNADDLKGRVREAVLEAKAAGRSQVEIPPVQITPASVSDLFTIVEDYTVIVGQPVQIVVSVWPDGNGITTWYKFRIGEVLTKQPAVSKEPLLEQFGPPAALLPLGAAEVLVAADGGSIVSEGITVLQYAPFNFHLRADRQYVLCVYLESSGAIASLAAMNDGAFELQPDGSSMVPIGRKDHPLVRDIYTRTGNSLEFLRKALAEQRR